MDAFLTASSSYSEVEGNKSDCSNGSEDGNKGGNGMQFYETSFAKSSSPDGRLSEEDELELSKAEMTQVQEENKKLKKMLEQIERDYQSLHARFIASIQPQNKNVTDDSELISLSLGRNHVEPKRSDDIITKKGETNTLELLNINSEHPKTGHLDKSQENSFESDMEKEKDEQAIWPPSKVLKTKRSSGDDEEAATLQQPSAKRARVSVRARCDSATMNDGCHWRKYGQKIAKGNPCPRAYYRCTVAPSCPVRKQVQRCMDDMSILTTTYEGTHNHPLPFAATAMASTTSAAASMLLSGSSTTTPNAATSPSFFQGLDFSVPRPSSIYLPNTSQNAFSTITLDLTTSSRFSSSQTNTLPSINYGNGYPNYRTMPYPNTSFSSQIYPSNYFEKNNEASHQQFLTETLTKAITSDPSLRSVINAAISSMVSNSSENKSDTSKAPLQFSL